MVTGGITAMLVRRFIGGCIWVWRPERKSEFDAAARLPLADDEEVKS